MRTVTGWFGKCSAMICLLLGAASAQALTEVLPASYVFDQSTACGLYCYHDSLGASQRTGTQLIDGQYGSAGWAADLGNGHSAEWVGWQPMWSAQATMVNIDFDFGNSTTIDQISVGTTQNRTNDVVLPSVYVYQQVNGSWQFVNSLLVPENAANNFDMYSTVPHVFLTLSDLAIDSRFVRVSLRYSLDGPWIFTDEVDFYRTAAPVPEPETYAMLLAGLGLMGAVSRRRKR